VADDFGIEKRKKGEVEPSGFSAKQIIGAVLVVVMVVLVLQNSSNANVHLLLFTASYPMWLVLGGAMVVAFLAGWLFGANRRKRNRSS
jgi:uncharacterized integral membrane protein